ncbi:MAG: penicillin-binding protein 2 [Ruminococcaceae bacterium]|nr:penicillin-binding protein 2 [Oscillospiraceae bacterium]
MNQKKLKLIMVFTEIALIVCMVSVFNVINSHGNIYMQKAVRQRKDSHIIKNIRGKIYDRNMISFVDSRTVNIPTPDGGLPVEKRYDSLSLLRHITGSVTGDGIGSGGLEEMYDDVLKSSGEICLNSSNDGSGKRIYNFYNNGYEKNIKKDDSLLLSIDYHIQKIAEQKLDESGNKGAVCIMDAYSFSPLALASRGNFDQNNVADYLNSKEGELIDRCTSSFDAGSIIKIVTVAAALENNIADVDFQVECNGSINIGGIEFPCHQREGHGKLNMEEAFAKSCNVYFYQLGNMIGIKNIYNTMKRFSLGQRILDLDWEKDSKSDILSNTQPNQIANIAIGQGNLLITPIQAVNMVNIIANDGVMKNSQLVSGVVGKDGVLKNDFRKYEETSVISKATAQKIKKMMRSVMVYGTGKDYNVKNTCICAKTGTAETGWQGDSDTKTHGWFVGFFPMENPRYSISVLLEDGKSGYNAGRVFESITKEIIRQGF